jgi:hypothetical protein
MACCTIDTHRLAAFTSWHRAAVAIVDIRNTGLFSESGNPLNFFSFLATIAGAILPFAGVLWRFCAVACLL